MGGSQAVAPQFHDNSDVRGLHACQAAVSAKKREMIMKNRNQKWRLTSVAALVATLFTGGAAFAAGTNMSSGTPNASIIAFNQKVKGDAVSIRYAFLPHDGTLDIYGVEQSGKLGTTPLGKVSLKAGDYRDVQVTLKPLPKAGMRLQAVIEKSGQAVNSGDKPERTFKIL